jgi:hypothetical protein
MTGALDKALDAVAKLAPQDNEPPRAPEQKIIIKTKGERECDECAEPATRRCTFLMPHYRSNPASSGYGKDDCSYCSDAEVFVCDTCKPETPSGMCSEYSTFYKKRFPHLFVVWREKEAPDLLRERDRLLTQFCRAEIDISALQADNARLREELRRISALDHTANIGKPHDPTYFIRTAQGIARAALAPTVTKE